MCFVIITTDDSLTYLSRSSYLHHLNYMFLCWLLPSSVGYYLCWLSLLLSNRVITAECLAESLMLCLEKLVNVQLAFPYVT